MTWHKNKGLTCAKILTGLVLFLLMLGSLVLNKLSLVWLLGSHSINNLKLSAWYATFGLLLVVPEAFALVKVIWHTSFIKRTKTHQWPSGVALCVGFLVSFAEECSYLVFTLEVAPRLPIHTFLPLMGAVHTVALCHEQWDHWRTESRGLVVNYDGNFSLGQSHNCQSEHNHDTLHGVFGRRSWKCIVRGILGFSGIWTSCAIAGVVVLSSPLPWFQALCLPTCLGILSLCWHPKVQVYIVRSHDGSFTGRWKATCVYTVLKLLTLLVGLSIVMAIRLRNHDVLDTQFFKTLWEGLQACRDPEILYPLMMQFGSGVIFHSVGFVSATICLTGVGITLPSLLATPFTVVIVLYFCTAGYDWLDTISCSTEGIGLWCACSLAFVTWIAPLILRGFHLNKSSAIILKPFEELFIQQTWNSFFLEHHMSLNYKPDGFSSNKHVLGTPSKRPPCKIIICTTMYREADFEMSRLLTSLFQVSQSTKLQDICFEAHIFLDNGAEGLRLTGFANQLISLLKSKMQVSPKDADSFITPYGLQLRWTLDDGMPFFIHLKDSEKVKAKKRWSQIMYMSYVLNFRVFQNQNQSTLDKADSTEHIDDSLFVGYASDKEWNKNTVSLTNGTDIQGQDRRPFPTSFPGHETPQFIQENRKHLAQIFSTHLESVSGERSDSVDGAGATACVSGIIPSTSETNQQQLQRQVSSDQGIGGSDDVSTSSMSLPVDIDSSETTDSRTSSLCRPKRDQDEGECSDIYEGDISSNNENSLTSKKVKKLTARTRDIYPELTIYEQVSLQRDAQRPVPPPRHKQHRLKRDQKQQRLQNPQILNKKDSAECNNCPEGKDNPAFQSDSAGTSNSCSIPVGDNNGFAIPPSELPQEELVRAGFPNVDENTYILATDADMEFDEESVLQLLTLCKNDRRIGGACGRTHPVGQKPGPLVWYQMFEYAKDFWMIKSAQNVIGSVMCCPGCFSLYRAGAVRDVLSRYAAPIEQPVDVFVKDTGEDRWMCTLMMLHGWKLEYTAFCDNTTYCPDSMVEFMKQRRRWVLSDMANMLLVFRNIFRLAQKNDSFSIAYILYMMQMFSIVLLSPASTIVILAGGLDIVYGVPFELLAPLAGVIVLTYALICIVGSLKVQVRVTLLLTILTGLSMLLVVVGGSVYVFRDMATRLSHGTLKFEEYHLILLLIAALTFAAFIHPKETWVLAHGASYLLGFPAMQILLPIYAVCNMVDQSWGTRDSNKSTFRSVSCFSRPKGKNCKGSRKNPEANGDGEVAVDVTEEPPTECPTNFVPMGDGSLAEEHLFWQGLHDLILGKQVNLGLESEPLAEGLRRLRNLCLLALLVLNSLWLALLSVLYFNADVNVVRLNVYGLIAGAVYGLVLFVQFIGMTFHRTQAVLNRFGITVFGKDKPVWIYSRTAR